MSQEYYVYLFIALGFVVIVPLAFYAGKLLYQLQQQKQARTKLREDRVKNITESIQTISFAMSQQQCNLSEGAIRLVNLLESLPIPSQPDWKLAYPALFSLYDSVKLLPTHEARATLSKQQRAEQDQAREEQETKLETKILDEVTLLKGFNVPV